LLNITSSSLIALHLLILIGSQPEKSWKLPELAEWLQKPSNTLSKILQQLVRQDFLVSIKGPHGGFKLHHPASSVRLLAILESMQGPVKTCSCLLGRKKCLFDACILKNLTQGIPQQMKDYLEQTTLEQAIHQQFKINQS
jgi:Rrf2 family protein